MVSFEPLEQIFQHTSCHAGNWLQLAKNPCLKVLLMLILILFHFTLVYFFINDIFIEPYKGRPESFTTIRWATDNFFIGPNITVLCSPRMFQRSKVEALNISDELLSYMFAAYDYGNDLSYVNNFYDQVEQLETDYLIKTLNISNIGQHLAIRYVKKFMSNFQIIYHNTITSPSYRCEDFISDDSTLNCKRGFNTKPWLSYFGTCFTTNIDWNVSGSGSLSGLKLKLDTSTLYSADFSPLLGERYAHSGVNLVLHQSDHALAALDDRTINLESGTSNRLVITNIDVSRRIESSELVIKIILFFLKD